MRVSMGVWWFTAFLLAVAMSSFEGAAAAAVPPAITHQGRLYDVQGMPVTATLPVRFAVYDAATDGVMLWSRFVDVQFEDGYFSVALGDPATDPFPAGVLDGTERYLGIRVGSDPEMSPRAAIRSVPYALVCEDVKGDIMPSSVSIAGYGTVIDGNGQWVGDPTGLVGPPVFSAFYQAVQTAAITQAGQTWGVVPGATVSFSLPAQSTIDMQAFGSFTGSGGSQTFTHCGVRFVVNGSAYGHIDWGDQLVNVGKGNVGYPGWWFPWSIRRWLTLPAGNYVINLQITGWNGSNVGCQMDADDHSRARMFVEVR